MYDTQRGRADGQRGQGLPEVTATWLLPSAHLRTLRVECIPLPLPFPGLSPLLPSLALVVSLSVPATLW